MGPLTKWSRLEAHAQTNDMEVGLAAEVADPLWLLARQLQLGEFRGEDGGSPVGLHVRASWTRLDRVRLGPGAPATGDDVVSYDGHGRPLESVVEAEPVVPDPSNARVGWWFRVHEGVALERLLKAAGQDGVVAKLRHDLPFVADQTPAEGPEERRYRTAYGGRVTDGVKVRLELTTHDELPDRFLDEADDRAAARKAVAEWLSVVGDAEPLGAGSDQTGSAAWIPDRVEYGYSVAAQPLPGPDQPAEVVLQAVEYDGSGVDWYTADIVPDAALGAAADAAPADLRRPLSGTVQRRYLPQPLRYPGQPADRFWEMEDAHVDLGSVSAGPTDLARMLAVEFAVVYGPDWYLAPLELPIGCVARIDWVCVRDTFGTVTVVGTARKQGVDRAGRQFQPASTADVPDAEPADLPFLVVPPAGIAALRGPVLESLLLQRDELANLAWGIEAKVLGPAGRPLDRSAGGPAAESRTFTAPAGMTAELAWSLSTAVPPGWVPFVSVRKDAATGHVRLVKARLQEGGGDTVRGAVGLLLSQVHELCDEEVTSAGRRVELLDQMARGVDGSLVVWRGRQTGPGGGEVRSHLEYDRTFPIGQE